MLNLKSALLSPVKIYSLIQNKINEIVIKIRFKVPWRKLIKQSGSGGLRYELKRNSLRVFAKRSPDPPRAGLREGQLLARLRGPEVTNVQRMEGAGAEEGNVM